MQAANKDAEKAKLFGDAIVKIEGWQSTVRGIGTVFSGLSLGSILVLMALGLSIIFGLMGVINMAHGELMMIGAYSTYITQQVFVRYMPEHAFDYYFLVAIPVSFLVAGGIGYLIEITVVRFLYGRPLETLLATWGVSEILIQAVRITFGDNIAVNSPSWLQGGMEILPDVVLPYNRCFIIVFCMTAVILMYWIIEKTKLGLLLRATTQNRNMAGSLGVNTRRIDGYTFALGAGLAGMAGCALTQVGGVTPDMGRNYIVDSFMVVVTGGVGKLAGAIWAGMGLGVLNKFLEPTFQAVWAKVLILIAVVIFLQFRPSGLFPAKGRLADA
jgi:urea transport system permease protein